MENNTKIVPQSARNASLTRRLKTPYTHTLSLLLGGYNDRYQYYIIKDFKHLVDEWCDESEVKRERILDSYCYVHYHTENTATII